MRQRIELLCAIALAACGGGSSAADAGLDGAPSDVFSRLDTSMNRDTGTDVATNDAPAVDAPPPQDSGSPTDSGPSDAAGMDAGDGALPCDPTVPFTPIPWSPPTMFSATACSVAQITALGDCLTNPMTSDPGCMMFRADPNNAACVGCAETDVGLAMHGPLVTEVIAGMLTGVEVNYGGCVAHYDGNTGSMSCGAKINAGNDCALNDCGGCSDIANPQPGGPAYTCIQHAFQGGSCSAYYPGQTCLLELVSDAGVAFACNVQLPQLIALWCGG